MVQYIDDQSNPTVAMESLVELANIGIDAVLGPFISPVATPIAVTATALEIPVVSNWATSSQLASPSTFFTRTCPSDDAKRSV